MVVFDVAVVCLYGKGRLIDEMRGGVDPETSPADLTNQQVIRIHQVLHQARFSDPNADHLSPAGEYNIRLGVMKEIQPDLVATHQGKVWEWCKLLPLSAKPCTAVWGAELD